MRSSHPIHTAQGKTPQGKATGFRKKALVLAVSAALGHLPVWALAGKPSPAITTTLANIDSGGGRRIVSNGSNRMLAIWSDYNGNGNIYGQYLLDGQTQGKAFRITSISAGSVLSATMNSHGDAVIVWQDTTDAVHAQIVPANTSADISSVPLNISTADTDSTLNVAMDDNGNFGVVWGDTYTPYLQTFDHTGYPISYATPVSAMADCYGFEVDDSVNDDFRFTSMTACAPDIAMNSKGDAVVTWSGQHVYARRYDINGNALGNAITVDTTPADDNDFTGDNKTVDYNVNAPVVAMDESGDFAVAWQGLNVINVQKWIAPVKKSGLPGYFTFDAKKSAVTRGILMQRFDSSDQPQKRNKLLQPVDEIVSKAAKSSHSINPEIAMAGNGDSIVVWQRERIKKLRRCQTSYGYTYCSTTSLPYSDIKARRYSNSTGTFAALGAAQSIENGTIKPKAGVKSVFSSDSNSQPAVAFDGSGNFNILFDKTDSDQYVGAYMSYEVATQSHVVARLYPKSTPK